MSREQKIYDKVLAFARDAHAGQKRKYTGEDYIEHPIEVSQFVKRYGGSFVMQCAALLHDVLEDTDHTPITLSGFLMDLVFRYELTRNELVEIQTLVVELTDIYTKEKYPDWNRKKRKSAEADRLGKVSAQAQTIKYCDILSNTPSITELDPGFAKVYLAEKKELLEKMDAGNPILRIKLIKSL